MPIDTTPSSVATTALQAIPFSSLIGGPLDAAIGAQAQAAQTSWNFIKAVGLTPDGTQAINVTFAYQRDGQTVNLIVPLLAIVPIPYIAIDELTIDFKANISASSSSVTTDSSSTTATAGGTVSAQLGWGPFSVKADFNANYSSKKDSKATQDSKYSVEYTMDVHVGASQSSMPAGLATVLNILQSSITEASPQGSAIATPAQLELSSSTTSGQSISLTLVVTDNTGKRVAGVVPTFTSSSTVSAITITPTTIVATDQTGQTSVTVAVPTNTPPATGTLTFTIPPFSGSMDNNGNTPTITPSPLVVPVSIVAG